MRIRQPASNLKSHQRASAEEGRLGYHPHVRQAGRHDDPLHGRVDLGTGLRVICSVSHPGPLPATEIIAPRPTLPHLACAGVPAVRGPGKGGLRREEGLHPSPGRRLARHCYSLGGRRGPLSSPAEPRRMRLAISSWTRTRLAPPCAVRHGPELPRVVRSLLPLSPEPTRTGLTAGPAAASTAQGTDPGDDSYDLRPDQPPRSSGAGPAPECCLSDPRGSNPAGSSTSSRANPNSSLGSGSLPTKEVSIHTVPFRSAVESQVYLASGCAHSFNLHESLLL
jgi:hypothetical protein